MKRHSLILPLVLSLLLLASCGSKENPDKAETKKEVQTKKAQTPEEGLTVEKYCKLTNETRTLLMEEYWEQFKGKPFAEVKDLYEQYQEDEEAIHKKYGIEDVLDISNYFRSHFKEIEEYRQNDPDFVEYPEYDDARRVLADFAMKASM